MYDKNRQWLTTRLTSTIFQRPLGVFSWQIEVATCTFGRQRRHNDAHRVLVVADVRGAHVAHATLDVRFQRHVISADAKHLGRLENALALRLGVQLNLKALKIPELQNSNSIYKEMKETDQYIQNILLMGKNTENQTNSLDKNYKKTRKLHLAF